MRPKYYGKQTWWCTSVMPPHHGRGIRNQGHAQLCKTRAQKKLLCQNGKYLPIKQWFYLRSLHSHIDYIKLKQQQYQILIVWGLNMNNSLFSYKLRMLNLKIRVPQMSQNINLFGWLCGFHYWKTVHMTLYQGSQSKHKSQKCCTNLSSGYAYTVYQPWNGMECMTLTPAY